MTVTARTFTIAGLVVGAAGIGVLWAAGVEFPVAVPPGMIILLAGALFVAFAPWRWSPAVGALLGLFVAVGFAISPTGVDNLLGRHGADVATGQSIQLIGVLTALVAGALATNTARRMPQSQPSRRPGVTR
ncbi:hypothetical protein AB0B57_32895 [Micromonospora sp. NPDC049101]|uniref:hypothetical protein n=1 Tax=unclassified Micromonospora TaxID=2617518 RepID=UPI0033DEAA4E